MLSPTEYREIHTLHQAAFSIQFDTVISILQQRDIIHLYREKGTKN